MTLVAGSDTERSLFEPSPARRGAAVARGSQGRWAGCLALFAVAALPIVFIVQILAQRPHVVLYGDQALIDLGARRAIHLDQLLGPYSRAGFHHPGPLMFYLLAPFVRVLEPSGAGLYLGAVILNGAALVAAVAVVWRQAGVRAALWAAAVIDLFCLCIGPATLREPWNPYLIIAPMILFLVLWAAGCCGSRNCLVWALIVGSFAVQTHIATAAVVLVLCAYMIVRAFRLGRAPTPMGARIGAVVLAVVWLPPLIELFRDHPNNVERLWSFFSRGHGSAGAGAALKVAGDGLSIVPFGNHDYALSLQHGPVEVLAALVLLAGAAVAAWRLARGSHHGQAAHLVAGGIAVAVIGTVSLMRSDGQVFLYFAVWLAVAPVAVAVAGGAARFGSRPNVRAPLVALAAVTALCTGVAALAEQPVSRTTGSGPWPAADAGSAAGRARTVADTAALTRAALAAVPPGARWVDVDITTPGLWPIAAGVVLGLNERGLQATVSPGGWVLYFGFERSPTRPVAGVLRLLAGPPPVGSTVVAEVDGVALTYQNNP